MELETIRAFFTGDRFAVENGMAIEKAVPGEAVCSMTLTPHHRNAKNAVMGGAIFTLADFAFAVAANWNKPLHVSLSSQITYLSAAKGTKLIAEARRIKDGHSTCYFETEIKDDLGRLVAHVTTNGFTVFR